MRQRSQRILFFSTPQMNFSGQGQIQEFMKYALIADRQIHVNASNVQVDGSVYAGADGILADSSGSGTLKGKSILTRGDIVTDSGSTLTVGNGNSSIWAENIKTSEVDLPRWRSTEIRMWQMILSYVELEVR